MLVGSAIAVILATECFPGDEKETDPRYSFALQLEMGILFGIALLMQIGAYGVIGKGLRPLLEEHGRQTRIRFHFFVAVLVFLSTAILTVSRIFKHGDIGYRIGNLIALMSILPASSTMALVQVLPIQLRHALHTSEWYILQHDFSSARHHYEIFLELEKKFKPVFQLIVLPIAAVDVFGCSVYGAELLHFLSDNGQLHNIFELIFSLSTFILNLCWVSASASLVPRDHARFAKLLAKTAMTEHYEKCQPFLASLPLTQERVGFRLLGQLVQPSLVVKCITIGSFVFRAIQIIK